MKQHRCRNWYSSGRGGRTRARAREGRGVCGAVGIMRKKSYWAGQRVKVALTNFRRARDIYSLYCDKGYVEES